MITRYLAWRERRRTKKLNKSRRKWALQGGWLDDLSDIFD